VAVAAAALLVAGCGGGSAGQESGQTTSAGSPTASDLVVNVVGTEYSFAPSASKVSPGETTIRFTNSGAMEHDLVIDALHVHLTAQPGKSAQTTVTLEPGTYKVYCSVPGHRESGMQGKVTVS